MLAIDLNAMKNGAHNNLCYDTVPNGYTLPEGWAIVPKELEEEAVGYLPFIELTLEDGAITGVAQGPIPEPAPPDLEEAAAEIRAKRNQLLAETDWTQLEDSQLDEEAQAAMRAYRQALRDIPQQEGFPLSVEWPEEPNL